jgi:nicotinate phosphoribosyltransferase
MTTLTDIYKPSLALLTDLYQLTMAQGYWKLDRADEPAVFNLEFRTRPFGSGYAIAAGLQQAVEFIDNLQFDQADLAYLATLTGSDGEALFDPAFLDYLGRLKLDLDIHAVEEGSVVFPHEPLARVTGPLLQGQLLETPLLNLINFQTLVATKAARLCEAAKGDPVIEFGLRRAQGIDGGLTASRAAYVGGCDSTSNVLAGRLFGIPVKGTHAHSWVMSFDDEMTSFEQYAEAMPNNCVFLVDTYDTLEGVRRAAKVGQTLHERGYKMLGIRLDSGDLAYLSRRARQILDAHGLTEARILASNDLDEHLIKSLKDQGAQITLWGVGTRLATAYDQPALGGVYKLAAIQRGGEWQPTLKLSEQADKINTPGLLKVRRFYDAGLMLADMIYDQRSEPPDSPVIVDPVDPTRRRSIPGNAKNEELLKPIYEKGRRVYDPPTLETIRQRRAAQLAALSPEVRRFDNPHRYPVGLEKSLYRHKARLILEARGVNHDDGL